MRTQPPTVAAERRLTVAPADSSSRWGNPGFEVLSTPAVLGHVESLCAEVLEPHLAAGEITVGVTVALNHRAPAQVGDDVVITVTASSPTTRPRTEFRFEVRDVDGNILCDGVHGRAAVQGDRFRERLTRNHDARR
jgi:predicted thioesterase